MMITKNGRISASRFREGYKLILQEGPVACTELSIVRIHGWGRKQVSNFSAIVKRSRKGGGNGKGTERKDLNRVKVTQQPHLDRPALDRYLSGLL